ncbi:MAG: cupin domain-containing protein [Candidatus Hydrogenedentes bacterium]|nr:cupin domain-containing protein [Candidatus Hydrogenedentota bacterium]
MSEAAYKKVSTSERPPERSTCGFRQRLILKDDGAPASITRLKTDDATPHWHAHTHEYYYVLTGSGTMTIGAETFPIAAGDCIWIKPGCMHHAEGELESLIVAVPAYDPADTFFEDPPKT